MFIIELHRTQTPFAVIVSNEVCGNVYSILFRDRYLRCEEMCRQDVRWFSDNRRLFKVVVDNQYGRIYEYKRFRKRLSQAIKHNFLVRNQIINGKYI
jgi:NAD-dependent dihydropyrimidine dehydrogenase PreA subunit